MRVRRAMIVFCGMIAIPALTIWTHSGFHTIEPGKVYGCSQLTAAGFEQRVTEYKIRSIINLRGPSPNSEWYKQEKAAAARLGITHIDVAGMSSKFFPVAYWMRKAVLALETCPKPVLVHCYSGVDRTGLMHIIWLLLSDENESPDTVLQRLSIWRFHCSLRDSYQMKIEFLRRYQDWLKKHRLKHSPFYFRYWIYCDYRAAPPEEKDL